MRPCEIWFSTFLLCWSTRVSANPLLTKTLVLSNTPTKCMPGQVIFSENVGCRCVAGEWNCQDIDSPGRISPSGHQCTEHQSLTQGSLECQCLGGLWKCHRQNNTGTEESHPASKGCAEASVIKEGEATCICVKDNWKCSFGKGLSCKAGVRDKNDGDIVMEGLMVCLCTAGEWICSRRQYAEIVKERIKRQPPQKQCVISEMRIPHGQSYEFGINCLCNNGKFNCTRYSGFGNIENLETKPKIAGKPDKDDRKTRKPEKTEDEDEEDDDDDDDDMNLYSRDDDDDDDANMDDRDDDDNDDDDFENRWEKEDDEDDDDDDDDDDVWERADDDDDEDDDDDDLEMDDRWIRDDSEQGDPDDIWERHDFDDLWDREDDDDTFDDKGYRGTDYDEFLLDKDVSQIRMKRDADPSVTTTRSPAAGSTGEQCSFIKEGTKIVRRHGQIFGYGMRCDCTEGKLMCISKRV